MCGIAGFCNGTAEAERMIRLMTDQMKRRGPDGEGYWMSDNKEVVLGHRRLSIIDCNETGSQPMVSHDGRYVISYNGEIYNHRSLRNELIKKGILLKGTSDTEVLLESFVVYGIKTTLELIKGMYAIALYDRLEKTLYLIRDRVGEKPLYYGMIKGRLYFGSDLACFEAVERHNLDIDAASVELYFRRGYIPSPFSIYKGIYKLQAGHYLEIRVPFKEYTDVEYWSAHEVSQKCRRNRFRGSEEEALCELERILKDSIQGQMVADVPLGAFLSAGIDSSTVVSLMQELSDTPVKTYTIGVDEAGYNEAPLAKQISGILATDHIEEYISMKEMQSMIPHIGEIYTEPFADSSQIPTAIISKIAKKYVTVVLSGDGGDELFYGYERYNGWVMDEWRKQCRFPRFIQNARASVLRQFGQGRTSKYKRLLAASFPELYAAVSSYDSDFVRTDSLYKDVFDCFENNGFEKEQGLLAQMDFEQYLVDDILVKVDRAAMHVSLETRIPFLDKDVIEFAWSLPYEMKYHHGVRKKILREILYKRVPKNIIERPKTGFSIPLDRWLRIGELREWAEACISSAHTNGLEFIDCNSFDKIWNDYLINGKWTETIWLYLMFHAWMDRTRG